MFTSVYDEVQMNGPNVPLEYQPDIKADRARDVYKKLLRAHGAAGLWRGVSAGIYKIVPHAGNDSNQHLVFIRLIYVVFDYG